MTDARELDLVLLGATGHTGREAARYLAAHAPPELRWGLAGRSETRLEVVRARLGEAAERALLIEADSAAPETLVALARRTRVLITTVGPYARLGDPVVEACLEAGTHYADITGETPWVRGLIDRFHERAASAGIRLVPLSGFDSVPSDLGTWLLADAARAAGTSLREVKGAISAGGGGLNGGTLASALGMAESGQLEALLDQRLLEPGLSPPTPLGAPATRRTRAVLDPDLERWLTPFVMSPINIQVVRRSAALASAWGEPYGEGFVYDEGMETKSKWTARGVAWGTRLSEVGLRRSSLRALARRLGPKPGQGPSEEQMSTGWYRMRFVGRTHDERRIDGVLKGQGDPGNKATVTFLCETGLGLALDQQRLPGGPERGGLLTPATALGPILAERLRAAGVTLEANLVD
jgi:short subunit dehydrogenase-like uncharacterized protein